MIAFVYDAQRTFDWLGEDPFNTESIHAEFVAPDEGIANEIILARFFDGHSWVEQRQLLQQNEGSVDTPQGPYEYIVIFKADSGDDWVHVNCSIQARDDIEANIIAHRLAREKTSKSDGEFRYFVYALKKVVGEETIKRKTLQRVHVVLPDAAA